MKATSLGRINNGQSEVFKIAESDGAAWRYRVTGKQRGSYEVAVWTPYTGWALVGVMDSTGGHTKGWAAEAAHQLLH